ncbi:MAG: helix-turn-helix transcriptional regulator [Bacteroidales bacterium]|nr:helix-turn-helix transcriptional regulator [Bacteroidales bacterium]
MSEENFCPIKDVLGRIGDKWTIYVITKLGTKEVMRFNELKSQIHGISQKMLTQTLRNLEQDGLIERRYFAEIPPRVEYQLTAVGKSLLVQLNNLSDWALQHRNEILEARKKFGLKS